LKDASQPCRVNMCVERICIPNDIEPFCRCGDDDHSCKEENEQKVEVVMNHLPDTPSLCNESICNGHGTCIQYKLSNNTSYGMKCECDEGYDRPSNFRCARKKGGNIAISPAIAVPVVIVLFGIVVLVLWWHPKLCNYFNTHKDRLRDHSSEGDDTETFQQDQQAKKLAQLASNGIGRSYVHAKKDNACVEQFVWRAQFNQLNIRDILSLADIRK